MLRIYVASSWRNDRYCEVVNRLRAEGHDVYDFRNAWDPSRPTPVSTLDLEDEP